VKTTPPSVLTYDLLKTMFPWASEEFLRANSVDAPPLPTPVPEPASRPPLVKAPRREEASRSRVEIRFDFYATRPKDSDNHFVKPLIDALRRASLIPDDDWKHVAGVMLYTHRCDKARERTEVRIMEVAQNAQQSL